VGSRALGALLASVAAALVFAAGASAALPAEGVLVPGESLGGIRVGMSKAEVRQTWGKRFGRCRSCVLETWYFTYRRFEPQGAAVAFAGRRVERVYTLWQPPGWRTSGGLLLGTAEADVVRVFGSPPRRECGSYAALVVHGRRADSVLYLYGGGLWGLGLMRPGSSPCV
jgi:hypothetical protein